jgi:hypothetical protein
LYVKTEARTCQQQKKICGFSFQLDEEQWIVIFRSSSQK